MAQLLLGDILKVRVGCWMTAQSAFNIRHFRVSAVTGTGATDTEVAADLATPLSGAYKAVMSIVAEYRGLGVQKVSPDPVTVEVINIAGQGFGTIAGDPLPPQIAGLVRIRTTLAGRRNRAFIYLPFPGEADNAGSGGPGAAYLAAAGAVATIWTTSRTVGVAGNTVTLTPIIKYGEGLGYADISGYTVRSVWSQQKRRSFVRRGDARPI